MRIIYIIVFIISLLLNAFFLILDFSSTRAFVGDLLKPENYETLRSGSTLLSSGISLVNFFWIISFAMSENRKKLKNDRLGKMSFWYRDIVLKNGLDVIRGMFDKQLNEIYSLKHEIEKFEMIISGFSDNKHRLISVINDQLAIINDTFSGDLDSMLDDYEDAFTFALEEYLTSSEADMPNNHQLINVINEHKSRYNRMLFEFEMNGYTYKCKKEKEKTVRNTKITQPSNTITS